MTSGRLGSRQLRFDLPESLQPAPLWWQTPPAASSLRDERLDGAVERTQQWLLSQQAPEGYWCGELEGDSILESEYILLLTWLGRERSDVARRCANYLVEQQLPDGGWAMYPGGRLEISGSVKAYFALKITGHDPAAEYMVRAREAILRAGGAEKVNSFTRYFLALLGVISYEQCPAVPPELILIPRWLPFNIYEMSAWSRTILIPLSLVWAHRPARPLPPEMGIRELFLTSPEQLSVTMPKAEVLDDLKRKTRLDWDQFFRQVDRGLKLLERWRLKPLRNMAMRRATEWMISRFEKSDGLGAIFPPIIFSIIALKCLGYDDDSPEVQSQLHELDKLMIAEGDTIRLQPCKSPVWDTAIATIALRDSGLPAEHPALRRSARWLLSKEVRTKGDWAQRHRDQEIGGWYFEFNNEFYPDVDDTSMVVMALCRCLPGGGAEDGADKAAGSNGRQAWSADFLVAPWSPHPNDADAAAVVAGVATEPRRVVAELESAAEVMNAVWRGVQWGLAMQSRDGGWGAFDADNTRELFTRVPFADHNAMIDPSTADLTARMLEMFASVGLPQEHPAAQSALAFVTREQEPDGAWYGRWGVNYIYGTWQTLVGLAAIGIPNDDPRVCRGVEWLKANQQPCGGWGETAQTYEDPGLRGQGPPTASQTAWALMGLMAAGETGSDAVRRGIEYLLDTQQEDGTWDEPWFTGTGFPKVFYLRYHLYRIYFPLMALGRYGRLIAER